MSDTIYIERLQEILISTHESGFTYTEKAFSDLIKDEMAQLTSSSQTDDVKKIMTSSQLDGCDLDG